MLDGIAEVRVCLGFCGVRKKDSEVKLLVSTVVDQLNAASYREFQWHGDIPLYESESRNKETESKFSYFLNGPAELLVKLLELKKSSQLVTTSSLLKGDTQRK